MTMTHVIGGLLTFLIICLGALFLIRRFLRKDDQKDKDENGRKRIEINRQQLKYAGYTLGILAALIYMSTIVGWSAATVIVLVSMLLWFSIPNIRQFATVFGACGAVLLLFVHSDFFSEELVGQFVSGHYTMPSWVRNIDFASWYVLLPALAILYGLLRTLSPTFVAALHPFIGVGAVVFFVFWWQDTEEPYKEIRTALKLETSMQRHIHEAYGTGGEHRLSKRVCAFEAYQPGQEIRWKLDGTRAFYLQSLTNELEPRTYYIGSERVGPEPVLIDRAKARRNDFSWGEVSGMLKFCGPDYGTAILSISKIRS